MRFYNRKRKSNIELLRIFSMIGIISLHYFSPEFGGENEFSFPDIRWIFIFGSTCLALPLVNCFVLITGYFIGTEREIEIGKICELLLITIIYGFGSYCIACVKELVDFSVKGLLFAIFPFFAGRRWFIETYVILLLIAPFINIIIRECDKKALHILISIQIFLFCIWYSIGFSAPILDDGYGIINFITLYLIGAYIKKYQAELKLPKTWICILLYGVLCTMTFILNFRINPFGYSFITNILAAIILFVGFLNWKIVVKPYINTLSAFVLDVYFIHTDKILGKYLFQNILKSANTYSIYFLIVHWLVSIVIIYTIGILVGIIRKKIFEKVLYHNKEFEKIFKLKISI